MGHRKPATAVIEPKKHLLSAGKIQFVLHSLFDDILQHDDDKLYAIVSVYKSNYMHGEMQTTDPLIYTRARLPNPETQQFWENPIVISEIWLQGSYA